MKIAIQFFAQLRYWEKQFKQIKPYIRATVFTGVELGDGSGTAPSGWISLGAMVSYTL